MKKSFVQNAERFSLWERLSGRIVGYRLLSVVKDHCRQNKEIESLNTEKGEYEI